MQNDFGHATLTAGTRCPSPVHGVPAARDRGQHRGPEGKPRREVLDNPPPPHRPRQQHGGARGSFGFTTAGTHGRGPGGKNRGAATRPWGSPPGLAASPGPRRERTERGAGAAPAPSSHLGRTPSSRRCPPGRPGGRGVQALVPPASPRVAGVPPRPRRFLRLDPPGGLPVPEPRRCLPSSSPPRVLRERRRGEEPRAAGLTGHETKNATEKERKRKGEKKKKI